MDNFKNLLISSKKFINNNKILNFDFFFENLSKFFKPTDILEISKFSNSYKSISFNVIENKIEKNEALEFKNNENLSIANAGTLNLKNRMSLENMWQHGLKDQNFSFCIFFNINNVISPDGESYLKSYSKEFLLENSTQNFEIIQRLLSQEVLRVRGFLNIKDISAFGFRYKCNGEFKFNFFLNNK